jgi:16S rRNA G966 N2-methylase RsmD
MSKAFNYGCLTPEQQQEILTRMDDEASYSVTHCQEAAQMASFCYELICKVGKDPVITDGCACEGGNVFGFALSKKFSEVNAVECNHTHYINLLDNVKLLASTQLITNEQNPCKVNVFHASYIDKMQELNQDIVFLDPPWGGKDYKLKSAINLELGPFTLTGIIQYLYENKPRTQYVVWKAPFNFDDKSMIEDLKMFGDGSLKLQEKKGFRNMKLFYVNLRSEMFPTARKCSF